MTYVVSEGSRTAWGGRTVKLDWVGPSSIREHSSYPACHLTSKTPGAYKAQKPRGPRNIARNLKMRARYLDGLTIKEVASEFCLSFEATQRSLRAVGTPMRRRGRRRA